MKIDIQSIRDIEAIADKDARILAAALMYAEQGFRVVPIRPNGKALPGKSYNFNYSHASRNIQVVSKWFGHGGKYEGWNVGIATGLKDGTFVVDLDTHGDVDGISNFTDVAPEDFTFHGPVQETPSGGKHLIFQWRDYATSSTGKIADGVDTRGGKEDKSGGHIVVWPSTIGEDQYKWFQGGNIEETPDWIMDRMGRPWQKQGVGNRGNENVGEGDVEDKFTLEQIVVMLSVIKPDELSYSEWLEVGQAIHSQHPTPEGLSVWDNWSQEGNRYESSECSGRWAGFNEGGAIRIGTLIHYAKQRGYELSKITEDPNKDQLDDIVEEMNNTYAIVPIGSDMAVLQEVDVVPELARITPKYRLLKKQTFRSLLENKFMVSTNVQGFAVKTTHADIWLAHEDRRTYPSGMGMFPNQPQRYQGYFNMWAGFSVEPKEGNWLLFKHHVHDVICNNDDKLYEWVMDWMADLVQDPANPKGCAIVMNGIEGCGKGTFAQFIGDLFGTSFKHITDEEHLVGRFNGHMADCLVAFADEVTYGGNRKVAGKLKALVSERYITAERKGIDAVQYHNCAHLLVASNEDWFIPAGPQSRRWLVLEVSGDRANDREYFNSIHHQMEKEGGMGAMLHELLGRKITSDLKKAPETRALFEQRAQYTEMDSINGWWAHQLATGVLVVSNLDAEIDNTSWPAAISKADALNAYTEWCKEHRRRTVAANTFFKRMMQFGLVLTRFRRGDKRIYGYAVPNYETALHIAKRERGIDLIIEDYKDED